MADEPSPKRGKMNDETAGSSGLPERRQIRSEEIIVTGTQNFEVIRRMRGFVDHTLFIQSFLLKREPKLAIFAPRRFGKSSHLDMVKKFLEIEVDETTGEVLSNERKYKIFDGTSVIANDKGVDVVTNHLGKHPVIHLDFKIEEEFIKSVEKARKHCRNVVHQAYLEHSYLTYSKKLDPGCVEGNATSQRICLDWCDCKKYKTQDLRGCLENLARFLYNHFDEKKVYILADECDAVTASALFSVCGNNKEDTIKEIIKIGNIVPGIIGSVTKGNTHVAGALITGVSYVPVLGYSPIMNNFTVMKFLEGDKMLQKDEDFVPFYGATKAEVSSLIEKLVQDKQLVKFEGKKEFLNNTQELDVDKIMNDVQSRYNGYFDSTGTHIFCLWSVLQYLQSGVPNYYWSETSGIDDLYQILRCKTVTYDIMKLMSWKNIQYKRCIKSTVEDLVELFDLMLKGKEDHSDPEIVFNFLIDQGYLSYLEDGGLPGPDTIQNFKLPNAEIRAALSGMIKDVVIKVWKVLTASCTKLIDDIKWDDVQNIDCLQNRMLHVYDGISEILKPLEQNALVNEARMLCTMYTTLNDAKQFELAVDSAIKDLEGKCATLGRPDFLLQHKDDPGFCILWELKYKKDTQDDYTTSLHALLEAKGMRNTKDGKTKNYMGELKKLKRKALVIGLSMDSNVNVSLSYSSNTEEKIFTISETERTLHSDLYKTYNPIVFIKKESDKGWIPVQFADLKSSTPT